MTPPHAAAAAAKAKDGHASTEAEQAVLARAAIAAAHAQPSYDLAVEPWIPVLRDGQLRSVGVRELLADAHLITDVAVPHPLIRAALRRLLGGMAADLIRRGTTLVRDDWWDAHRDNAGFPRWLVDEMVAAHADHLWLWHPQSPYLQEVRLAAALVKPQDARPVRDLVLGLPSGHSAAWWVKANEPALVGGLDPATTARWLTVRWFYAANGNCGDVVLPGTAAKIGAQDGGAFAETVATITQVWRADGTSLFRTLLRNLTGALVHGTPGQCAWLDPVQPQPSGDALYQATLTTTSVLLAGRSDDGDVTGLVRGPVLVPKDTAKAIRDSALAADPHRVRVDPGTTKGKARTVRVAPAARRTELLREFHRAGFAGQRLRGVVSSGDLWLDDADSRLVAGERLELLLVSKGGTGSSPVWEELSGPVLPARHVDPDSPYAERVRAAVAVAFHPKDGMHHRLSLAVLELLAGRGPDGWQLPKSDSQPAAGLTAAVLEDWLALSDAALRTALDDATVPIEQWRQAVQHTAHEAFAHLAAPYLASTRYAPRYATATRKLTLRSTA